MALAQVTQNDYCHYTRSAVATKSLYALGL